MKEFGFQRKKQRTGAQKKTDDRFSAGKGVCITMGAKHGNLSINSDNIFPIIKKWLYSDKDIFIRELISNGCDAVSKHKRLVALGEVNSDDKPYKITVAVSKKNKI